MDSGVATRSHKQKTQIKSWSGEGPKLDGDEKEKDNFNFSDAMKSKL